MQKINKHDLGAVLLNCLLCILLCGIVLGFINYFTYRAIQGTFTIFALLASIFISFRVRKAFDEYHLLYTILAMISFAVCYYISFTMVYFLLSEMKTNFFGLLVNRITFETALSFLSVNMWRVNSFGTLVDLLIYALCLANIFYYTKANRFK